MRAPKSLSPQYVVTLVHGTFATEADWTRPSHHSAEGWQNDLGSTIFAPFKWSGSNSHEARLSASRELRSHLRALLALYPNSTHCIIAHSHGGNVALHALGDTDLQNGILALVCLATPYIHCYARDYKRAVGQVVFVICAWAFLFTAFAWWLLVPRTLEMWLGVSLFEYALGALGWVAGVAIVPTLAFTLTEKAIHGTLLRLAEKQQAALLNRISLPHIGPVKVCSLQYTGDEARRYLKALSWVANVPFYGLGGAATSMS